MGPLKGRSRHFRALAVTLTLAAATFLFAFPCQARRAHKSKASKKIRPQDIAKTAKQGIEIGTTAVSKDGGFRITLKARFQHYRPNPRNPMDRYDPEIQSPKSVKFHPSGDKVYVNSLEGYATVVYDSKLLQRIGLIRHHFDEDNQNLISPQKPYDYVFDSKHAKAPNYFSGKPVEMEFTKEGKQLWVSYYHRSYDENSLNPSAVAVIDTSSDTIVSVLPSGPIPKYLAASPDGKWMAMIHWGDNTVGLVKIGGSTESFKLDSLITIERRLNFSPKPREKIDRDRQCGFCLRGAVFSSDSKYLLVGKLSGGGIAVIDIAAKKYIGTVWGMAPTPRHLVLSKDGKTLFVSSNVGGAVSKFDMEGLIAAAGTKHPTVRPLAQRSVGYGVRTIALSPDGQWVFAAVNGESKLAVLRSSDLSLLVKIAVDSFPVGLAVSPDNRQAWVTSQGRSLHGGNSVSIYEFSSTAKPTAPKKKPDETQSPEAPTGVPKKPATQEQEGPAKSKDSSRLAQ